MLLARSEFEAIKSGTMSLVFRRWRRPTVKTGGSLRTAAGVLEIGRVEAIERSRITEGDAVLAGFASLPDLLSRLDAHDGDIYRIEVRFAGADPRLELREDDRLSEDDVRDLRTRLSRLDSASKTGAWTRATLRAIDRHPRTAAADLAKHAGVERTWLKRSIRKLKNLGLTISHARGYELSPRGRAVLSRLPSGDVE